LHVLCGNAQNANEASLDIKMDLAILEWKLVRERALFASTNNPKSTVRVDTEFNISAMDLVEAFCRKGRNYSGQTIRRLINSKRLAESDIIYVDRPGNENRIMLVPYRNAVKLMMLLPGDNAMKNRAKFAEVLHRYYASDDKEDTDKNIVSEILFEAMAKATLAALNAGHAQGDQTPAAAAAASSAAAAASAAALAAFAAAAPAASDSADMADDDNNDDAMSGDNPPPPMPQFPDSVCPCCCH